MRHPLKARRPRLLEAGRVPFLALPLMLFCVLFAATPAFAAYSPLHPHDFPAQDSGTSMFFPYHKNVTDGISDSSTFSIYVPAGIKSITFIIDVGYGDGHVLVGRFGSEPTKTYSSAANLTVSQPRAKLSDFMAGDFVAKLGGANRYTIIEDSSPSLSTGGWIYFKLYKYDGTSLSPRAYSSQYVVDPALYSPPEGYVPPPPPSDDGGTDDGSSDGGTDTGSVTALPYTTEASGAAPSASYTYGPFDLTGHGGKSISIEQGEYSIDGTSSYTNSTGTIPTDAAELWVRATASTNYSTVSTTKVLIGGDEMVKITLKTMAAPSSGDSSFTNPFGDFLQPRDPNPPDAPDDGTETPDAQPVRLRACVNGEPLTPQNVPCDQLDGTNFLQPILEVDPEFLPAGMKDEGGDVVYADAYAIFTFNGTVFMVVTDALGNLTVIPYSESGFRPFGTAAVNLADGTWQCNAFETVQDFLVGLGYGPEEVAQWHEDGIEVVFYFGIVPNGDWNYFQGAAFQIVK